MNLLDALKSATLPAAPAPVLPSPAVAVSFDGTRREASADFALPVAPVGKVLFAHQAAAVETILASRRVLLALQPGMGKTLIMQAVAAAVAQQGGRALCIVPPSLRISPWAREFATDFPGLRVAVVEGTKPAPFPADADVVIIGDSVIAKRMADAQAWAPTMLCMDEAHRAKNRAAARTKAVMTLADSLPAGAIVVMATGTVVDNRITDVWAPLRISGRINAAAVSRGDSYSRFLDEWCETQMVWTGAANVLVATGARDPQGLRHKLTSTCMISVPRSEVLDLPERTTAVVSLEVNGEGAEYRRAEREFLSWVQETRGDDAVHRAAKAEAITKLMALWELDGRAKVKAAVEHVAGLVEQGEQVVVFGHHVSVVERLTEGLLAEGIRTEMIVGGATSAQKDAVVERFQAGDADKRTQVIVGNITAAGTGLTLTAAVNVVFVQLPWAPGTFGQAQDRIYRIGQTNSVTTHVLGMVGGVSETLWGVLAEKAVVADTINIGEVETLGDAAVIDEVLARYGW